MTRNDSAPAGARTHSHEYLRFTIWHLVIRLSGKFDSIKAIYISHAQGFGVAHIGLSTPKEGDGNGIALFFGMCGWRDCTGGRKAMKYGRFNLFAVRWPRFGCRLYRVRKVLNAFAIWDPLPHRYALRRFSHSKQCDKFRESDARWIQAEISRGGSVLNRLSTEATRHRFCVCGHSHMWHTGGRGRCARTATKYGRDCTCPRFKKAKSIEEMDKFHGFKVPALEGRPRP